LFEFKCESKYASRKRSALGIDIRNRSRVLLPVLPLLLSLNAGAHASSQACAETISELRVLAGDQAFPLRWEETTMNDSKPLVVSILERKGSLFLEFVKTDEGLWLESAGVICRTGADLEARLSAGRIRLGPAANWVLRHAVGNGGTFRLTRIGVEQLQIATGGWSGTFSPRRN
jgi:hypothetical protein